MFCSEDKMASISRLETLWLITRKFDLDKTSSKFHPNMQVYGVIWCRYCRFSKFKLAVGTLHYLLCKSDFDKTNRVLRKLYRFRLGLRNLVIFVICIYICVSSLYIFLINKVINHPSCLGLVLHLPMRRHT